MLRNNAAFEAQFEEVQKYKVEYFEVEDPKVWKLYRDSCKSAGPDEVVVLPEIEPLVINENIVVEELAPKIFDMIRIRDGITTKSIMQSLAPELNREMVFKAGESKGKSGSFFFFSHDRRFIIKTMKSDEIKIFKNMFWWYFHHLMTNDDSLIARIYGIFTVYKEKLVPVHLILMDNTIRLSGEGEKLKYIFDLKGSLVSRETKMKKRHNPTSVLKDVNLLEIKRRENILKFFPEDRKTIISNIKKDVIMLRNSGIMDYSLLLAIEENPHYKRDRESTKRYTRLKNSVNRDDRSKLHRDTDSQHKF